MSPPFIGLSGKQKYWVTLVTNLYVISILVLEECLQKWWNTSLIWCLYEKWLSVRKRKLLKTVTYIVVKERLPCIITIETVTAENTTRIIATETPICIITTKTVTHIFAAETVTCICAPETSNCIIVTETVTCLIATERSTNIPVTKSTTSKPS